MLGKVHGPYMGKDGFKRMIIVHHNEQGQIIKRASITYDKYLKEVEQGLHSYEKWVRPIKIKKKHDYKKYNYYTKQSEKEYKTLTCHYYETVFSRFVSLNNNNPLFCSKGCYEKQKRKSARQSLVIKYDKQIVVKINAKKDDPHYVIYEQIPGNKQTLFIPASKCQLVLSEDTQRKTVFRLQYDRADAVRIRPVPGYKKLFWITETGVFVSKRTKNILTQETSKAGYKVHSTRLGGRYSENKLLRIHRCVADGFIPNPDNKPFVNHIDAVKINNHYTNLEWCTPKENSEHAAKMGLIAILRGEDSSSSTLTNAQAKSIRDVYRGGGISNYDIASLLDISYSIVRNITSGTTYV